MQSYAQAGRLAEVDLGAYATKGSPACIHHLDNRYPSLTANAFAVVVNRRCPLSRSCAEGIGFNDSLPGHATNFELAHRGCRLHSGVAIQGPSMSRSVWPR